jgi:hypothetical protein
MQDYINDKKIGEYLLLAQEKISSLSSPRALYWVDLSRQTSFTIDEIIQEPVFVLTTD